MPIPVDKAMRMVEAAHQKADQLGIAVTAAVVDEGGRLIAVGRMDKARPLSLDVAINKAYTAAQFQQPTSELAAQAQESWFTSLVASTQGKVMGVGGGLPIEEEVAIIGAVGVSGGTADQDEECCKAAAATMG